METLRRFPSPAAAYRFTRPTFCANTFASLNARHLKGLLPKTRAAGLDAHGTITDQIGNTIPDENLEVMEDLLHAGLRLGIISTAASAESTQRVLEAAEAAGTKLGCDITVLTSRLAGGIRKPNPRIFKLLATKMDLLPPDFFYVGNEVIPDIMGPLRAGYGGAVLIRQRYGETHGMRVRLWKQPAEAAVRTVLHLPR